MFDYMYVPAYMPMEDGGWYSYWALVPRTVNQPIKTEPLEKYVFRIQFRPDSWNMYSISQNATSKYEAIQLIITSINEINSHMHDPNFTFYSTIDSIGPETTNFESILQHYEFILEQLYNSIPEVYQINATEWNSSLA
tara:strand:- start:709 stop:1122 length:414 start_codon:yes stop_codon:yes gene_type:complete